MTGTKLKARIALVSITIIVIVGLAWSLTKAAHPAPIPKEVAKDKSWSELILGKWKRIEITFDGRDGQILGETTYEFTRDGKAIRHYSNAPANTDEEQTDEFNGLDGEYFKPRNRSSVSRSGDRLEIVNSHIESLTDDKLITVTLIVRRYTLKGAQMLTNEQNAIDQILATSEEEIQRSVWVRISR
jgi:hypothetical protein